MNKNLKNVLSALALLVGLILLAGLLTFWPADLVDASGAGDPGAGTMVGYRTVTFADGTSSITSTTYYNDDAGSTVFNAQGWYNADVFVTADISGTNTITVTPQFSADGTNWVDAQYKSEGWVLPLTYSSTITNSSGVTNTTTSTQTYTFSGSTGSRQSEWVTYQIALSSDTSDYLAVPLHGNYLRFKAEVASADSITPTIYAILRNDGGR
jgi:hypothetical protein